MGHVLNECVYTMWVLELPFLETKQKLNQINEVCFISLWQILMTNLKQLI